MVNYFKSSVYHLFHGHTTFKDPDRYNVFNKHKTMDKQGWIEYLMDNYQWGIPNNIDIDPTPINDTLLYAFKNTNKPMITICIVNYLRYETLINTLKKYSELGVTLNVILWVNDCDRMDQSIRKCLNTIGESFHTFTIMYCKTNMGTGYPRHIMMKRAYYEFDSPYIMTSDDDIMFDSADSLIMSATILHQDKYKKYGGMGIWVSPLYNTLNTSSGKNIKFTEGFHKVDTLGASTMTIRREVLNDAEVDPNYIIGLVDWDFSLSIRKAGWELGLLCDPRFKPNNIRTKQTLEYENGRWNDKIIKQSKNRFKQKWGISV